MGLGMLEIEYRQLGMSPYGPCILLVLICVTECRNESKVNDSTVGYITQMRVVGGILFTYPFYLETCFALEQEIIMT
jgi:hypothetical protein